MVEKFFKDAPKVNVSRAKEKDIEPINKQNREIIEQKEYLLLDFLLKPYLNSLTSLDWDTLRVVRK